MGEQGVYSAVALPVGVRERENREEVDVAWADRVAISVSEDYEERDHEVRAALLGIEASAQGLRSHRDLFTAGQFDVLAEALVDEVRRLRAMLDGRLGAPTVFDLADAIAPVVSCARASGLDVHTLLDPGIEVNGRRDSTAQIMLALLDNAREHAASSPVEVRATVLSGAVALYVEDRGPGITGPAPERVFERGVRGDYSVGSGLGLFIARRLMTWQGGTIAVRSRAGGGTSFVLRFRQASPQASGTHRDAPCVCRSPQ